jgi:ATP-dependent Clp protease adaptor protein ClpS
MARLLTPIAVGEVLALRSPRASITEVETRPVAEVDSAVEEDRPWVVIVWNDPINLMSYVTYVLQKLFGYSLEKATELMLEVHHEGRSAVASGSREQAEMHVFRLHEHGLWATMEHDS